MPRPVRLLLGASVVLLVLPRPSFSQDIPRFYEENCSACHTIGGGAQGGPDLKSVTSRVDRQWLIRFMLDPDELVEHRDPYALKIVQQWDGSVMPETEGLTPELAEALLRYIEEQSGVPAAAPPPPPREFSITPDRISAGRALFVGSARLQGGGPPCLGCHRMNGLPGWNGGRLGPDLSAVHARLQGPAGTVAWLGNPPTSAMKAVYRGAVMAAEEREALAAFFASATRDASATPQRTTDLEFAGVGIAGAVAGLVAFSIAWRRRFRGVRQPFLERARPPLAGDHR